MFVRQGSHRLSSPTAGQRTCTPTSYLTAQLLASDHRCDARWHRVHNGVFLACRPFVDFNPAPFSSDPRELIYARAVPGPSGVASLSAS